MWTPTVMETLPLESDSEAVVTLSQDRHLQQTVGSLALQFETPRPFQGVGVEEWRLVDTEPTSTDVIRTYEVAMSGNDNRLVVTSMPRKPKSDVAVVVLPTLLNGVRSPKTTYVVEGLSDCGYPVVAVGPHGEQLNRGRSALGRIVAAAQFDVIREAWVVNRILDSILPTMDVRQKAIFTTAKSRGAGVALGLDTEKPEEYTNGRRLLFGEFVTPVYPQPIQARQYLSHLNPRQLLAEYRANKRSERVLEGISLREFGFQTRVEGYDKSHWWQEWMKAYGLAQGGSGILAGIMRPGTPKHFLFAARDKWAQPEVFRQHFAHHVAIRYDVVDGGHIDAQPHVTLEATLAKFRQFAAAKGKFGKFEDVDFWEIINREMTA